MQMQYHNKTTIMNMTNICHQKKKKIIETTIITTNTNQEGNDEISLDKNIVNICKINNNNKINEQGPELELLTCEECFEIFN